MFSSGYFVTGVKVRKITSGELGFCPLGFSWGDVARRVMAVAPVRDVLRSWLGSGILNNRLSLLKSR